MRTITGRVRPFGSGTVPSFVRVEWPETLEEVAELSDRLDGDVERGVLVLAAKKGIIALQDAVRNDESWDEDYDPPEDPEELQAWTEEHGAEIQERVNDMLAGLVIDPGTYPGETSSKKKDKLDEARQDPEQAAALIEELRARHGL